ncbi:AI-2E family transporter [Prosthecomicrobium pneumaticum]|uniref:Putative PurR-regulated permease PerM n=1 Tax=Prosthecomicrobium pneumaticum TaxID=81895 RepID=A0A7W9FLY6_9HYPH|nr:AI-2E family transporter [Prosthecomicrobium pneumaticum]MBB5753115.1 putative PurR-regulated permease PerM [Prosthecomicrobium pneumaticum]
MTRSHTSLLVLFGAAGLLLLLAPDVFLIVFAGVLLAVFLHSGGAWIGARLGIRPAFGVGLFLALIVLALLGFGAAVAPAAIAEVEELARRLPEALTDLHDRIESYSIGAMVLERVTPDSLAGGAGGAAAMSAVSSTFGVLGNFVVVLFIGLYGAIDPGLYRRGLERLLEPALRSRGGRVLRAVGAALRNWLIAQLAAMAVVGGLTGLGLWLAGIPLAFALGLVAGLLAFIPNIGPVLAIAPALLLALPQGRTAVLVVLAVYLGVQALESYVVTPLLQQEKVSLAPALVIAAQLLAGVWFGLLGLALATPLTAALMTLVRVAYVENTLEDGAGGTSPGAAS